MGNRRDYNGDEGLSVICKTQLLSDLLLPMMMNWQVSVGEIEEQLEVVVEDNVKYNK